MHFENNLRYLSDFNIHILDELLRTSTEGLEFVEVGPTKVFKLIDEEGKEFYSASIYDPSYEAEVFLRDTNFDNTGFIVMGLNSYEVLKKILERKTETAWVFVIERDLRLIRQFLEDVDLQPFLQNKPQRLVFFGGDQKLVLEFLRHFLHSLVGYYFLKAEVLRTFPTWRRDKSYYDAVFENVVELLRSHVYNIGNDLDDTLHGIRNELANVKTILTRPRLKDMRGTYQGKPIICVASGPSLDKQMGLLKEAKGKCLILCAESAFRALLRNGIVPDIVCILERGANSYEVSLQGIDMPEETALFGLTIIDPRIFAVWPKYAVPCFKENLSNSRFLHDALGEFGQFPSGNSVAHMCYMLAVYLGGNPIILVGQDLAFGEDGRSHSVDTVYNDPSWMRGHDGETNRNLINLQSSNEQTVYLDGYYGGKVKSKELWRQFLIWMQLLIQHSGVPTINATEGGADIKGTIKMSLREALDRYGMDSIPQIGEVVEQAAVNLACHEVQEKLKVLHQKIGELAEETKNVVEYAKENMHIIENLIGKMEREDTFRLELEASRALGNVERTILNILSNELLSFYFRPLIASLHVQVNPISRITSVKRLKEILIHQYRFLHHVVVGGERLIETYEKGFQGILQDFGLSLEDLKEGEVQHNGSSGRIG